MSISYTIDREKDLTTFALSGELSFHDFKSTLDLYREIGPTSLELYNTSSLSGKRLSSNELNMLADYLSQYNDIRPPGSKTAIVASGDLDYGLSRMISILTEGRTVYNIQAFRSMDEANEWLLNSGK
jgi:hypothetical protein